MENNLMILWDLITFKILNLIAIPEKCCCISTIKSKEQCKIVLAFLVIYYKYILSMVS